METIAEYTSQKDEIARLNKQIDMIAGFYYGFYKDIVKKSKEKTRLARQLGNDAASRSAKLKAERLKIVSEFAKAKLDGLLVMTNQQIADRLFVANRIVSSAIFKERQARNEH